MFTKTASKKITITLFAAIISATIVLIAGHSTFAKTFGDMTPSEKLQSVTYYDTLRDCVSQNMYENIKTQLGTNGAADPTKVAWFDDNNAFGYVIEDGKRVKKDCKNIVVGALKLWGWGTDYTGFLKKMGYTYQSSVPQWHSTFDRNTRRDRFDTAAQSSDKGVFNANFTGYAFGQLSDSSKYLLYSSQLGTCGATKLGLVSQLDQTLRDLVNNNKTRDGLTYTKVSVVDNGRVTEYGYSYTASNVSVILYGYSNGGSDYGQQKGYCASILPAVSKSAPAYAMYGALLACTKLENALVSTSSQIEACANGFLNPSLSYCTTTYKSNTGDRKACYIGQGNEAIEACTLQGYTVSSELQACVSGSKNKDSGYCTATFIAAYNGSQFESKDAERAACVFGQTLVVSDAPAVEIQYDPSCTGAACEVTSSCSVDGIGWIVCPVINFLANIADGSFGFLANNFLQTDPKLLDTNSGTYEAWKYMRTFANVAFVIVFLIIIFSQLTGVGVSNYGVKKMMPRIVVAAILVNVSFFISQIAVDISNILGFSIKNLFDGITAAIDTSTSASAIASNPIATGQGFAGLAGGVLAVAAVGVGGYALLSTLAPVLIAAVIALVVILFILIARQAIVVLLIVVSPLAFVAFLLPNTESLFKQWRKMLTAMLVLFPIVALVFGASTLASHILSNAFDGSVNGDTKNLFGQVIASAILVLPLFAVPVLLRKSLDGIPVIGQMANKLSSRANGSLGKRLGESRQGSVFARGAAYRKAGREAYRTKRFNERVADGGLAGAISNGVAVTNAGRAGQESLGKSIAAAGIKAEAEEIGAAKDLMAQTNMSGADRHTLATTGSVPVKDVRTGKVQIFSGDTMQRAAIQEQMQTGSYGEQQEIINASSVSGPGGLSKFAQTISKGAAGIVGKDPAFAGASIDKIAQGKYNYDTAVKSAIKDGRYNSEAFAAMNDKARADAIAIARKAELDGDSTYIEALRESADGVHGSAEASAKIAGNPVAMQQLRDLPSAAQGPRNQP